MSFENAVLFPDGAAINDDGHLVLGGCDAIELASEFGTPLYVFDEPTLRGICRSFVREFADRYPNSRVLYASKAFISPALARLVHEEGLGLDVVSGGELAVAAAVDFPPEDIYFHGNNKSAGELEYALDYGIGRIVVDNFHELRLLNDIGGRRRLVQKILLRVSPGVDPHTHVHTTTGTLDSKFGFSIESGDAAEAVRRAVGAPSLDLIGIHSHLGSPIFELEPFAIGIDTVLTLAADMVKEGLKLEEFSPGGGFAIGYTRDRLPPEVGAYAEVITSTLKARCADLGIAGPKLLVEPGRAVAGRPGVALYTVGAIKDIPGVRKYVSLDGGMGDNIRPALYDARYEAVAAGKMTDGPAETVTLAGKYCESGDVLVRDIRLPVLEPGDLIAIPASGAYAPAMASNYNSNPRPAIVMVGNGNARLIRRRETYEDLMLCDILEDGRPGQQGS